MDQSQREQVIFKAALELGTPEGRSGFVKGACGDDSELRQRVEALLSAYFASQSYLPTVQMPGAVSRGETASSEEPGMMLGRYKLLQKIGEGGCGTVYMAEQEEPVRRRVALKIIKLGMDTRSVIARFEAERQALARMEHANIARVLDAGATESGRPYFVMELVRGIKITEYCDQNQLSIRQRLDLFIQVCHAIQHAHQKGIIHRDIKPSNILVSLHDGKPVPVVIDFGIAKATEQPLTDQTAFTALDQFIGTPAYMSPEQADLTRLDIDTRSDIYALGVLLYELLSGTTPFDSAELLAGGLEGMRRTIREEEPARPSTRLDQLAEEELQAIARRRRMEAPKLVSMVRGDLDWIVMKCLEKDRTRRYETAAGIAQDIGRYVNHRMVEARPPTTVYKVTKFVRRNKVKVGAAGLVAGALVLGVLVSAWQSVRATQARRVAVAEREHQRGLAYAADMNLLQQALGQNNLGRARGLLDRHRPKPGEKDLRGWEWRYLWKFCHSDDLVTLFTQAGTTMALGVSSDGKWLAAGDHVGGLAIYDLEKRLEFARPSTRIDAAPWSRVCLAFSPREPLLAYGVAQEGGAGDQLFSVRLWSGTSRSDAGELPLTAECAGLAFSGDGERLATATAGDPAEVAVWNVREQRKLVSWTAPRLVRGFPGWPLTVDSQLRLAACCSGRSLRVVDVDTGKTLWTKETPGYFVASAFSPDGKVLVTSSAYADAAIRRWDAATGTELPALEGHRSCVYDMIFWPDGQRLASASSDQTIRIWDLTSLRTITTLRGHQDEVWRVALLPDNASLVSGGKDGTVRLWTLGKKGGDLSCTRLPDPVSTWCFSADGRIVYTVDESGNVVRRQGGNYGESQALFRVPPGVEVQPVGSRQFSPDGRLLAASTTHSVIQVWDLQRGSVAHELTVGGETVFPVAFLGLGTNLVVANAADHTLHRWNLPQRREEESWTAMRRLSAVAFSPDERWCLMVGYQGDTLLRDMRNRQQQSVKLTIGTTESVAFSPDGRLVAAADWWSVARLWEAATLRDVAVFRRFLLGAHSLAFSPDGLRLAVTSSGQETAKLWDVESHQELLTLASGESRFIHARFSPNGNVLGAVSMEGHLHLWRAPSWAEIEAVEKEGVAYLEER